MKKGFTLIELLAVIVILAIIALIATPIILGIINDAREESNERSVELYAAAVKNGIAAYQLTGLTAPKSFSDLTIEYDGDVKCTVQELYEDGSFYLEGCKVNKGDKEYSYGTKQVNQVYKPQYYGWSYGNIGEDLPSDAKNSVSEIDTKGYPYYLGYDVDANNKVTAAYACFTKNGTEYCLKGNDTEAFITNSNIIKDAFSDIADTNACFFDDDYAYCGYDGLIVDAYSDGGVDAGNNNGYCRTRLYDIGSFECQG